MNIQQYKKEDFAWLEERAYNKYSQFGEDGIIEAILDRIGTENKWVMECGAADGVFFSNSRKLIEQEWNAVLIEADNGQYEKLTACHQGNEKVRCWNYRVESSKNTFDQILDACTAPSDLDLAVIDVDGQDYWLFNSLLKYKPRVVMVEYDPNADPDFIPPIDGEGQAGRNAIIKLGIGKLYYPVCATWCNVIFVRQELAHMLVGDTDNAYARSVITANKKLIEWPEEDALPTVAPKIAAVISIPQLGHNVHNGCQAEALATFGIGVRQCYGVFWHQALTEGIQKVLEQGADYVLTLDYDALFTAKHVADLVSLALANPDVDVLIPCMTKREGNGLLAHTKEQDETKGGVNLNDELIPIQLGHFGLTLFKSSVFDRLAKPWFQATPDERGGWGEGHIDADMNFWLNAESAGLKVMLARHVRVGHIEYMATIPNAEDPRKTDYVHVGEWRKWAVTENQAVNERLQQAKEQYV